MRRTKSISASFEPLDRRMMLAAQAYDWGSVTIKANGFIDGIVYSPAAPNVAYIHTDMGGAYRWDQSAEMWQPLNDWSRWDDWGPQNLGVETMAAHPTDPNKVYMVAGTYNSPVAILRSNDGGRTWLRWDSPIIEDPAGSGNFRGLLRANGNGNGRNGGQRLSVDPNNPNVLYYGSRLDGLWRSTDAGASWARVNSFPVTGDTGGTASQVGIVWTLIDKASATAGNTSQTIFAGVSTTASNKIYISKDGGGTWNALAGQPATAGWFPIRAALAPDGATMYMTYSNNVGPNGATTGSVYKVTNPSAVSPGWATLPTPTLPGSGGWSGVVLDPGDDSTVVISTLDNWAGPDDVYRSTDSGLTWRRLFVNNNRNDSSAPYASTQTPHWLGDIQIDPFNSDRALFTTGYGLYQTTDLTSADANQTVHWDFFNEGFEQSAVLELASPNTGSVHLLSAIGDRDGYRHVDFDQSSAIGLHGQNNGLNRGTSDDIDVAFTDANFVVRIVRSSPWVQYSNDNGVTWNWFSNTGTSGSTGGGGNIAISADGTKAVYEPGGSGRVRFATRTGSTWSAWTSTGITNQPADGAKIVADLADPQTFYAYAGTTVSRTTNGGSSWTVMTASAPNGGNWIRAVPGQAGHLVMSRNSSGVWRSTNGGATWTQLGGGATVANQVGVGAGPTPDSYPSIYIGGTVSGQVGFFRSDDQGTSWTMINDLAHQYGYVTVIQGDPRVYGRLYVGANGRGVLYADIHTGPSTLPNGWSTQDIGSPGSIGNAGESAGSFEVIGGGAGVPAGGANSDQFRFAYQTLSGDGTITAKVIDVPNGSPNNYVAKAGVMIRSSLAGNSANAFVALTPGSVNGVRFQTRVTDGAATNTIDSATTNIWPPYWVRLTRVGNQFTAFISPDGVSWTALGSPQSIAMGTNVFVGLAVTASNNNQLNISRFEDVSVVAPDTTPPTVSASDYLYQTAPNRLTFKFSEDVSASLSAADLLVTLTGGAPVAATYAGYDVPTQTAAFTLPTALTDGDYQARLLAPGITDAAGNPLAADHVLPFFFMLGDADHDRDVDVNDLGILASHWQLSGTFADGDFDYSGTVEVADLGILASRWQNSLPAPSFVVRGPSALRETNRAGRPV